MSCLLIQTNHPEIQKEFLVPPTMTCPTGQLSISNNSSITTTYQRIQKHLPILQPAGCDIRGDSLRSIFGSTDLRPVSCSAVIRANIAILVLFLCVIFCAVFFAHHMVFTLPALRFSFFGLFEQKTLVVTFQRLVFIYTEQWKNSIMWSKIIIIQ